MNILKDIELLDFTANQQSQDLRQAEDFKGQLLEQWKHGEQITGDTMPWEKTKSLFLFRPGEVTLWAGENGSQKSLLTGMVALYLSIPSIVTIASLEMPPVATLNRMARQGSGCDQPSKSYADYFFRETSNLWIYDQTDTIPADRVIAVCHYAAQELGTKHIFVDSLVKCGISPDDYSGQARFMDALCWISKRHNVHVHLIHHIRKGENDLRIPTKWDIKGAGELTDLASNVIIVAKNKRKQKKLDEGGDVIELADQPDSFLRIEKQRNGKFEDTWGFWFHEQSLQWIPKPNAGALPWPNYEKKYGTH